MGENTTAMPSSNEEKVISQEPTQCTVPPCPINVALGGAYELANRVAWAESSACHLTRELDRARLKIAQMQQREDAFSTIIRQGGATYAADKTGRLVELMNHQIEWAFHIVPQPPSPEAAFYIIKLCHVDQRAVLSEAEFASDAGLIQALQTLPGVRVRRNRSRSVTAFLLREALNVITVNLPFYGGWQKLGDGTCRFFTYEPLTTWRKNGSISEFRILQPIADSSDALRRLQIYLYQVVNEPLRDCLALWFHAAAIVTLLDALGSPFRLGLYIDASEFQVSSWMKSLFSWFNDAPVALIMLPQTFNHALICRKDQPLLVADQRGPGEAAANAELLNQVLSAWEVPVKKKKVKVESLPLQSLPIILSTTASSLSCHPCCLAIEMSTADLKEKYRPIDQDTLHRYLRAFISYTQDHIPRLRELLSEKRQQVLDYNAVELDLLCSEALGVLLALKEFLDEFAQMCGFNGYGWCKDGEDWLITMLERTCWKESESGVLADQFVSIARSHITSGSLRASPVEYREHPGNCVVYYDDETLSFTRKAFEEVCRHLDQSGAVVLRSLIDAGLLVGKPINATTPMTRISIWNQYGARSTVSVYRLARSTFDLLGDPLTFDGEGEL